MTAAYTVAATLNFILNKITTYLRLYSGGALWLAQSFVDLLLEFMSKGAGLVIGASLLSETIFSC
ncbi:MAG: hypothetical protein WBM78_00025 [Desulfobacterales bacterium]